jgi:lysophospholipase L1-like esterase
VVVLAAGLMLSLAVNLALAALLRRVYAEAHAIRLDPTGAAVYAGAATPPADPAQPRIVLFGDSRAQAWTDPPVPQGCEAVNRGIGNQTTAQILLRLDRDVLRLGPRVVVLQAGVNDLKTLGLFPDRAGAIVEGCRANLRAIVDRLRAAGITVVVTTIFPVGPPELARRPIWSDATVEAIDEVNRSLRDLAGVGVIVVDCDPVLRQGHYIDPRLSADTLHLNPAGYRALDAALRPALARALSDLPHAVQ